MQNPSPEEDRPLWLFAKWIAENRLGQARQVIALYKGETKLLIHDFHRSMTGILKCEPSKPQIKEFRPWRQSIDKVVSKLIERGWTTIKGAEVQAPRIDELWSNATDVKLPPVLPKEASHDSRA